VSNSETLIELAFEASACARLIARWDPTAKSLIKRDAITLLPRVRASADPTRNGLPPDDIALVKRTILVAAHRWFQSNLGALGPDQLNRYWSVLAHERSSVEGEDLLAEGIARLTEFYRRRPGGQSKSREEIEQEARSYVEEFRRTSEDT